MAKRKASPADELTELLSRCHPYVCNIVEEYGKQGAYITVCPKCGMLKTLKVGRGMTVVGPALTNSMYCQHAD